MDRQSDNGRWVNAICWGSCGGRCVNKVLVKNGVPIRQKTDDTHPDSPDYPQQRACTRGRAYRQMVLGKNRIKHPMRRKHWAPGGGQRELRGNDEFIQITWDEALDSIAAELRRIRDEHGNASVLAWGADIGRMLSLSGGYIQAWGSTSWGTWLNTGLLVGHTASPGTLVNDRLDMRKCELIILWGANPAWTSGGNPMYHYIQAKKAGARFICIDPVYTETAQVLGAEWIPIRPCTDHAMALGLAHTLITDDDPSSAPLVDWDFLRRCTVGFGAASVPQGEDPKDNLKDYILGTYDGQPKDAEWAAAICGVEPGRIRGLAHEIGCTHKIALLTGWAPARVNNADSWPQMLLSLGWIGGHAGLSGRMTGLSAYNLAANGGAPLIVPGSHKIPAVANPIEYLKVNNNEVWSAVLDGRYTVGKGETVDANIRVIYHSDKGRLNQLAGTTLGIRAHRAVELVVSQEYVFSTQCKYADFILPVTTPWEKVGNLVPGNREMLILSEQVIEPLYESKHDAWVAKELGRRLGVNPDDIEPVSPSQRLYNQLAGAQVAKPDGNGTDNLVTITEADIRAMGVVGEPQVGRMPLAELREKGVYQVERSPGDNLGFIAYEDFRQDPEANPLQTTSGKLEIHCRAIADYVRNCGWDEISPIPAYNPAKEGYESTFSDWPGGQKGQYPLQLVTPHGRGRTNSMLDRVPWLDEAFPQELLMSEADALERGISDGDTVLITSRHGRSSCRVHVSGRIMPGTAFLPEGRWAEVNDAGVDIAGSANVLVGAIPSGQGQTGWNSCNAQVEKIAPEPARAGSCMPSRWEDDRHGVFEFDADLCTGCKACQVACKDKNNLGAGEYIRHVETWEEGHYPKASIHHVSLTCKHCEDAPCLEACPGGALSRGPHGAVTLDKAACELCGQCVLACPYGEISILESTGQAVKCDLCSDLLDAGEEPACVAACVMRVLRLKK